MLDLASFVVSSKNDNSAADLTVGCQRTTRARKSSP
jgi:hypothetical protein